MKNPRFNTHEVKRVCETKLGMVFRSGAEFNGWFRLEGKKAARVTIPYGRKQIPPKTYKSMAKQLKLDVVEFDDLLACPLDLETYQKILKNRLTEDFFPK